MKNLHKVPAKQWRKWSKKQRKLFNRVYEDIRNIGADLFLSPVTIQRNISDKEFKVIAWNAAWTAAHMLESKRTSHMITYHDLGETAIDIPNRF